MRAELASGASWGQVEGKKPFVLPPELPFNC